VNDTPQSDRIIELFSTVGTALILNFPTGIGYTNQAGGTACLQPTAEGVLIPFENDYDTEGQFLSLETDLAKYFESAWGSSGASSGINAQDADAIDALLRQRNLFRWFCVDREKLKSSFEAWIRVTVHCDHSFYCRGFGPYPRNGILTWANSD